MPRSNPLKSNNMYHTSNPKQWTFIRKIAFRFIFIFFSLILFPFPLNVIPKSDLIFKYYDQLWTAFINWSAKVFFQIEQTLEMKFTGSGDMLYNWMWYFCIILAAFVLGIIFTMFDRKRSNYNKLQGWFNLILRYYLAYILLNYGIIKLFYLQFSSPSLETLFHTYGQSSPMHLMWTFMGFSKGYTIFSGAAETIAGLLLLFGRTKTLGALIAFGVMLNVFVLNMCYDIPVKQFSFQLLLMASYLISLDWRRLFRLFILNKAVAKPYETPLLENKNSKMILLTIQLIFVCFVVISMVIQNTKSQKLYGEKREKSTLYGVYDVTTFVDNNDTIPPLLGDQHRWKKVLFDYPDRISIITMDDNILRFKSEIDTASQRIKLTDYSAGDSYEILFEKNEQDLALSGNLYGKDLFMELTYYDISNFALLNRGFHWINEVPYNRYNYEK